MLPGGDLTKLTQKEIRTAKVMPAASTLVESSFGGADRYHNEQAGRAWDTIAGMVMFAFNSMGDWLDHLDLEVQKAWAYCTTAKASSKF